MIIHILCPQTRNITFVKNNTSFSLHNFSVQNLFLFSAFHLFFLGRSFNGMSSIIITDKNIDCEKILFQDLNSLTIKSTDLDARHLWENVDILINDDNSIWYDNYYYDMISFLRKDYSSNKDIVEFITPTALQFKHKLYEN